MVRRPLGTAPRNKVQAERGFTLIEIMLTLAVLGLLGAIVSVNLGGVTKIERLRAAARKLAGTSDFVRSQAAGTKRTCYLEIDFDLSRFRFWQELPKNALGRYVDPDNPERPLTKDEVDEWKDAYDWDDLPSGVYFRRLWYNPRHFYHKGKISIEYRPNGTVDAYILWLQVPNDDVNDEKGIWYSVVVNGLSGQSEVRDFAVNFPSAVESDFREVMGGDVPGGE